MSTILPIPSNFGIFDPIVDNIQMLDIPNLYLYYMSQDSEPGFNSMRSCVVCAHSQREALDINPYPHDPNIWPGAESIKMIGKALGIKAGTVICASFNHLLLN